MVIYKSDAESRCFPRVDYRAYATLVTAQKTWPVHILDLSFNGALAALIYRHELHDGEQVVLTIELEGDRKIKMQGHVAHQQEHFLGLECHAKSIDHQARLRELLSKHRDYNDYHYRSLSDLLEDHDVSEQDNV